MSISLPAAIRRTRQELAESQARVEALRVRLAALEDAARELLPDENPRVAVPEGTERRTDAILAVMRSNPAKPWGAAELAGPVAARRNSVEHSKDIAAALSYLRDKSSVWSPHRGEWMLAGMLDHRDVPPDDEAQLDIDTNDVPPPDINYDDVPF